MTMFRTFAAIKKSLKTSIKVMTFGVGLLAVHNTHATIVQFQTVMGDFEVNLYDQTTPKTVANFLAYVQADAYDNSIIHRSVPSFVVQGGGFAYPNKLPLVAISQNPAVVNEPMHSNKRGTISMAKLGGNPNSATNQWFFNLVDNSANLDSANGGYTVFGEVMGRGMDIIDAMAAVPLFNMGSPFDTVPIRNYTATDASNKVVITDANLVLIRHITVLNANADTAVSSSTTSSSSSATLSSSSIAAISSSSSTVVESSSSISTSASSEAVNASTAAVNPPHTDKSGGGNMGLLELLMLFAIGALRVFKK